MGNRGMKVNMNKTNVIIGGERQKLTQKAARWCLWQRCQLVVIQYSVLVVRRGYTRSQTNEVIYL